jgi:lipopolysaccharide transport system permease protein
MIFLTQRRKELFLAKETKAAKADHSPLVIRVSSFTFSVRSWKLAAGHSIFAFPLFSPFLTFPIFKFPAFPIRSSPMPDTNGSSFLADFARKRDLWWQFTVRTIEMRHRGSYLGIIWSVLNPLLMLGLYVFVFGFIFKGQLRAHSGDSRVDFALGLFLGLILFNVIADTIAVGPTIIVTQPNLVKKVVFPLEVLPLSQLGAFWFHLLISLALLLVGMLVLGRSPPLIGLLWLPVLLLPHLLLTTGMCWLLAALGVFFRDINQVVGFMSQIILYASGIFYSTSIIPPAGWAVLKWNPLLETVQLARATLLWHQPIDFGWLGYTYFVGATAFVVGGWLFRKMQPAFADVI